ncbi:MAG TPA: hypothetical protein VIF83_09730 [Gemmatimonadaceae bacterium]
MTCLDQGEPLGARSPIWLAAAILIAVSACAENAIHWSDPRYDGPQQPSFGIGRIAWLPSDACEASVRIARAGATTFATWWELHSDGSARLIVSRMDSTMREPQAVAADTADHSRRECGRPAPAIAVSPSGYVHLAYFAEPVEGSGVFYAHSMDGGLTFHTPVAIVFGDKPSAVSVAAAGDTVVVAYEDPNSERPSIGLALSQTIGHIFSMNSIASPDAARATLPVVRIGGRMIRLWWSERSPNPAVSATRPVYREGRW